MTTTITDVTIPDSPEGFQSVLADNDAMKKLFASGKFPDFLRGYAKTVLNKDQEIATQVREATQREVAKWLKENGSNELPKDAIKRLNLNPEDGPALSVKSRAIHNPNALGAKLDNEFTSSADFFRSVFRVRNNDADAALQAKMSRVKQAFQSDVPSEGGFLIPETLRAELLRVSLESSIIRPRARVVPMDTLRVPYPIVHSTSNETSVYGGIVTYWTEEAGKLERSSAKFGRVVLDAKKLTGYAVVPNEMITDSIVSFEAFINTVFPEALAFSEDAEFIDGDGVGKPLGFRRGKAVVSVSPEANQPNNTIVWENLIRMYARMLPSSLTRCIWIASPDTFPELATMALSVGTGGSPVWLGDGVNTPPMSILGRPVVFSEKVPSLGSAGDISLVDLSYYLIGDRQAMSASSSEHVSFDTDETAFRFIQRVDGRPWIQSAITPKNGGDPLSPFVQIAARQ